MRVGVGSGEDRGEQAEPDPPVQSRLLEAREPKPASRFAR
jgi:hypothetical protein